MSESLSTKRCRFTHQVALLILEAERLGFTCALDQVKRTFAEADANAAKGTGIKNSLHTLGLAADLLLYRNGVYLTQSEDYSPLGSYWKGLSSDSSWGGDFRPRPDGNHFSLEHEGVK